MVVAVLSVPGMVVVILSVCGAMIVALLVPEMAVVVVPLQKYRRPYHGMPRMSFEGAHPAAR